MQNLKKVISPLKKTKTNVLISNLNSDLNFFNSNKNARGTIAKSQNLTELKVKVYVIHASILCDVVPRINAIIMQLMVVFDIIFN